VPIKIIPPQGLAVTAYLVRLERRNAQGIWTQVTNLRSARPKRHPLPDTPAGALQGTVEILREWCPCREHTESALKCHRHDRLDGASRPNLS
jgi:hypothetical protein